MDTNTQEESRYMQFAKKELSILGYDLNDTEEGPNKWIMENLFELLEVFGRQGHSGSSAPYCANMFKKLALFEPLSPVTGDDSEWVEVGDGVFQNNRCSAVFKQKGGKPYYLDAIVWRGQNGSSFTGTVEGVRSRQVIRLPFTPKTFYVDVVEHDDRDTKIKDKDQLRQVFEYYVANGLAYD